MVLVHVVAVLRFLLTAVRPLSHWLFDTIGSVLLGRQKQLPPVLSRVLLMSATELADRIRKRKLSSELVTRAFVERVRAVNPVLNACVDQRFEAALADARAVDKMIQAGTMTEGQMAMEAPLLGVPFSCKEIIGVHGLTQTDGLLFFRGRKAPADGAAVSLYRGAGAIPLVVTNVPTISMWWETSNLLFGRTMNPYDHRRTAGGSSGGEAALLSSAGSVIGIGTDIGGSIRIPAAFCGIYGHKPSRGVVSNDKPWPFANEKYEPFRSTGPMCRYAKDLSTLLRVLSGRDAAKLDLDKEVDFRKVKIYYMEELPGFLLSATHDVKAAVRKAVAHFEEAFGASPSIRLTTSGCDEMRDAFDIWQSKLVEADGPPIRKALQPEGGRKAVRWTWELLKCLFGRARYDFPLLFFALIEKDDKDGDYHRCLERFDSLRRKMEDVLSGEAVLLLPTHPEPAPHILTTIPKVKNIGYTCIFNSLGYPVTSIPAGMSGGVPVGLQAVAGHLKDRLTLATAVELEKVFGGWVCPSEISL